MEVADLNADGVRGFEAQIALRKLRVEAVWPEHFKGSRVDSFRRGRALARLWLNLRRSVRASRRRIRTEEFARTVGMMTLLRASTASDLPEEQITSLKQAFSYIAQAEARTLAAGSRHVGSTVGSLGRIQRGRLR